MNVGARALPLSLAIGLGACASSPKPTTEPVQVAEPHGGTSKESAPSQTPSASSNDECSLAAHCEGQPPPTLAQELKLAAAETRGCYERALRENPQLAGRVGVEVRIKSSGHSCSARIANSAMQIDEAFQACLLGIFARSYPAPDGGCVTVAIPLNFQSQGADAGAQP